MMPSKKKPSVNLVLPEMVWDTSAWDDEDTEEPLPYDELPGTCECGVEYNLADALDHCAEEGSCWQHCADPIGHVLAAVKGMGYADGAAVPAGIAEQIMAVTKVAFDGGKPGTPANPVPVPAAVGYTAEYPEGTTLAQHLKANDDEVALVDHVMHTMGANETGRETTPSELVALYMTKVWIEAESQHAEVVAYSEGVTLINHRKAHPECVACANIAYYDKALNILKVEAQQEVEQAEIRIRQARFMEMGVCVECGEAPVEGRRYTLDEGKGFMCANCCGPYLLMDDGQPGNPWKEG